MKNIVLSIAILLSASVCTIGRAQAQGTAPAGTPIRVRTIDAINVGSARPGSTFRGALADPVVSRNGAVLIPRGAPVQLSVVNVKRSGRVRGRDRISLRVHSITFNGRSQPVVSSIFEERGGRQGSRTLRRSAVGAGAGAAIGGIAGGGSGAAIGSLVGGGGGTAVAAATGGRHLRIPSETVLSFQLQSPMNVR